MRQVLVHCIAGSTTAPFARAHPPGTRRPAVGLATGGVGATGRRDRPSGGVRSDRGRGPTPPVRPADPAGAAERAGSTDAGAERRRPRRPSAGRTPTGRPSTTSWSWAAGPAGSSCAYWLADAGWDVVVVEKKRFPREKTCGDGLTPRAVRQLADMGLEDALAGVAPLRRACGPTASGGRWRWPGRSTRPSPPTATPSPATTSTGWWPSGRSRPGPPSGRGPRRSAAARTGCDGRPARRRTTSCPSASGRWS